MLNVPIWFLTSVACQWKWQTPFLKRFAQPETPKHHHHLQLQVYQIVRSVASKGWSRGRNYLLLLVFPLTQMKVSDYKKSMNKLRTCINKNNSNKPKKSDEM